MGRLVLPSGRAVEIENEGREVWFLGTDATVDVDDLIWLGGYFRESGGSIPAAVCPECQQSPCIGHPGRGQPPHLNKTGGSDVERK